MKGRRQNAIFMMLSALLLALAVYWTLLIFWEMPGGQMPQGAYGEAPLDEEANLLRPGNIYMTLGAAEEGSYARLRPQEEGFEDVFARAYAVLERLLAEDDAAISQSSALPWRAEACILSYPFSFDRQLLADQLTLEEAGVFQKGGAGEDLLQGSWDEIWIVPSQGQKEALQVYLLDQEMEQCVRLEGGRWDWEENQLLLEEVLQQTLALKKEYIAAAWAWPQEFSGHSYVLEQTQRETAVGATASSAFVKDGEMDTQRMRDYGMSFFEYPDTVSVKENDANLVLMNEKTTVKVDASGRLQYVETLTDAEKQQIPMREAYQLAAGFLRQDQQRLRGGNIEYVLARYEVQSGSYVFYFNYEIGGIPYRMERSKSVEWRTEYPIKITVEGTKVRRYERYVLDVQTELGSEKLLEDTWLSAADALEMKWNLQSPPHLSYYLYGSRLVLQWEADTWQGRAWRSAN